MKIVAESRTFRNTVMYIVKVIDGDSVITEKTADSIARRDELIWELAELYNTTTIVVDSDKDTTNKKKRLRTKGKTVIFKFSEIPSIPVLDITDAEEFFDSHEDLVYSRIIVAVKEGLEAGLESIKLFELAGTGVYFTSERENWKSGLKNALVFFEGQEEYEKCATCVKLLNQLA